MQLVKIITTHIASSAAIIMHNQPATAHHDAARLPSATNRQPHRMTFQ
jgi:hypothetical protein